MLLQLADEPAVCHEKFKRSERNDFKIASYDWLARQLHYSNPVERVATALPTPHVRRLLGTHQWQSALLVMGLPVTQDWFEMGCHLSSSLISIRLTA